MTSHCEISDKVEKKYFFLLLSYYIFRLNNVIVLKDIRKTLFLLWWKNKFGFLVVNDTLLPESMVEKFFFHFG